MICSKKLSETNFTDWLSQGAILSNEDGKVLVGWGKASWYASPEMENSRSSVFYFPDYFLKEPQPWLHFENTCVITIQELLSRFETVARQVAEPITWELPSKEIFENGFQDLQNRFSETPLEKAVLYTFLRSSNLFSNLHRKQALESILKYTQKTPVFPYGYWIESQGILGATPELLFRSEKSSASSSKTTLKTMALAGTQTTDQLTHEMLENSKLLHEHQVVVDDIVSQLSLHGIIDVGPLQVLSLPLISHLYTPISVRLPKEIDFVSCVRMLHPTPALGGFPRKIAFNWLTDYSRLFPRERFGAPVGYWDYRSNQMACYVGIRNVMWDQNHLKIGAGCGIVAESEMEMEWEEILLKIKAIRQLLGI